jgi:hypothetical protein
MWDTDAEWLPVGCRERCLLLDTRVVGEDVEAPKCSMVRATMACVSWTLARFA